MNGCPRCSTPGMTVMHFVAEMCPRLPPPCLTCAGGILVGCSACGGTAHQRKDPETPGDE